MNLRILCSIILASLCQFVVSAPFNMFDNSPIHHSSAQANSNAFNNVITGDLTGSSASSALAQSFNTNNFGASASHSQNQGFLFNRFGGIDGNANFAGSQSYTFGDKKINVAYSNGFSIGPDGQPLISNGHSITFD